jgi:hypothetical protein
MKTHSTYQKKKNGRPKTMGSTRLAMTGAGPYHGERADEEIRAHDEGDLPFAIQDSSS